MRVLGLVERAIDDAVADERATAVACAEGCVPLSRDHGAQPPLDCLDRRHRILRGTFALERLIEEGRLAQLRGRELQRVHALDAISDGIFHDS